MMFIILNISDSDKHWNTVIDEYTKRLGRSVKITNIKPSKNGNTHQIIAKDTETIIAHLQKFSDSTKILLSKEGKCVDTHQLASLCTNKDMVFVIG
jgi:23S rRNA pseudoU1915 N3-methylase RlmH